jgi:type I restriction enzyme M protein
MQEIKQFMLTNFFLEPADLFSELARSGNAGGKNNFILSDPPKYSLTLSSTWDRESEEDFWKLISDLDLTVTRKV